MGDFLSVFQQEKRIVLFYIFDQSMGFPGEARPLSRHADTMHRPA